MKPEVDFWLFLLSAQLESDYSSTNSFSWPPYVISCSFELFRYCKMVLTALVCWWPGFFANWLATEVAKAISGLVSTIENMIELVIP